MMREKGDQIIRAEYSQRVLMDVLEAARRPDSHAVVMVDLSAAEAFRRRYKEAHGVSLTTVHLLIKALALMIEENPWMNYMVDGYKIIKPSTIDIGVSAAAEEGVTPVVVIREANRKSLREISEELKAKAAEAVQLEKQNLERLNRLGRLIPVGCLRRPLIRFVARRYWVRRRLIGTAQITSLGFKDLAFHLPTHMGTTMLLSVGGVTRRPVVVGDKIEIRPTAYLAFQVDTRVLNAKKALRAFRRFRQWLESPEALDVAERTVNQQAATTARCAQTEDETAVGLERDMEHSSSTS